MAKNEKMSPGKEETARRAHGQQSVIVWSKLFQIFQSELKIIIKK